MSGTYPGSGTDTPVLGLPDDTFSDEDVETAEEWRDAFSEYDLSDSDHFGGTRADRRQALREEMQGAYEWVSDPLQSAIPWWLKWLVPTVLLVGILAALSYTFGQLFTFEV